MMLGWFKAEAERASCSKRASRSVSSETSSGRTFRATSRPSLGARARYTSAIPPAPSRWHPGPVWRSLPAQSGFSAGNRCPSQDSTSSGVVAEGAGLALVNDDAALVHDVEALEPPRVERVGAVFDSVQFSVISFQFLDSGPSKLITDN